MLFGVSAALFFGQNMFGAAMQTRQLTFELDAVRTLADAKQDLQYVARRVQSVRRIDNVSKGLQSERQAQFSGFIGRAGWQSPAVKYVAIYRLQALTAEASDVQRSVFWERPSAKVDSDRLRDLVADGNCLRPQGCLSLLDKSQSPLEGGRSAILYSAPYVALGSDNRFAILLIDLGQFLSLSLEHEGQELDLFLGISHGGMSSRGDEYIVDQHGQIVTRADIGSRLNLAEELSLGGQRLVLTVYGKTRDYPVKFMRLVIAMLVAFSLTAVIAYLMLSSNQRAKRINELVQRRTRALSKAKVALEQNNLLLKDLNKELFEARQSADEANQAKSDFLATISHELRTPLNAILGFSDMLASEIHGPITEGKYVDYANNIQGSGKHLLSLINDILDLAKLESGKTLIDRSNVELDALVDQVTALTAGQVDQKGLKITFSIDPALPNTIIGDELRLRQILINLVGNAIKFTAEGKITCSFDKGTRKDGAEMMLISVEDTGVGIPAGQLDSLFDRFTQVDSARSRSQGGVGLGLAICKELVNLMNGEICLSSEEGVGTKFEILLPLEEGDGSADGDII